MNRYCTYLCCSNYLPLRVQRYYINFLPEISFVFSFALRLYVIEDWLHLHKVLDVLYAINYVRCRTIKLMIFDIISRYYNSRDLLSRTGCDLYLLNQTFAILSSNNFFKLLDLRF